MFVGREHELNKLEELYRSSKFEMAVVYGRRRVGKTFLLNQFCKGKKSIFYVGIETTSDVNLSNFSKAVWDRIMPGKQLPAFGSFAELFRTVSEFAADERLILVIDEYPYLAAAHQEISSFLQECIDHQMKSSRLFLILCGSSMSFMEKQVLGAKSPLYGRRTAQFKLLPFTFKESCAMLSTFKPEEKAVLFGVTGGIPEYLDRIDGEKSMDKNIEELFFDPSGRLFEEPQNLLKQELNEPAVYNSILSAVASGRSRLSEIAVAIRRESSAAASYVNALVELGILKKETPATEPPGKKTIYTMADQMYRFWFLFVESNISPITAGYGAKVYSQFVKTELNSFMGPVFEQISKEYLMERNGKGELPLFFSHLGRWWGGNLLTKRQEEIDIVAEGKEGMLFGECKWTNEPIDTKVMEKLRSRAAIFQNNRKFYYFFSKAGFTRDAVSMMKTNQGIQLCSFQEML